MSIVGKIYISAGHEYIVVEELANTVALSPVVNGGVVSWVTLNYLKNQFILKAE